eukprot:jgi/Chlat1/3213/Chrsp22S03495
MGSSVAALEAAGSSYLSELRADPTLIPLREAPGWSWAPEFQSMSQDGDDDADARGLHRRAKFVGRQFVGSRGGEGISKVYYLMPDTESSRGAMVAAALFGSGCEGPPGHAHGGALAALLDDLMGAALGSRGYVVRTRELTIRYRRPVPLNKPVRARAVIERQAGRDLHLSAWLETDDKERREEEDSSRQVLTSATAIFTQVGSKPPPPILSSRL